MHRPPPAWPRLGLFPAAGAAIAASRHRMPASVPEHSHEFAELVLVARGSGLHACQGRLHRLRAGDLLLLTPGTWHAYRSCRDLEVWDLCIGHEVLHRELAWLPRDPELAPLAPLLAGPPAATLLRPGPAALAGIDAACTAIRTARRGAVRLAQLLLALDLLAPAAAAAGAGPATGPVREALRLLAEEPQRPWTLIGLAARLGTDRSHLARAFRAAAGLPPMAWLARLRCDRAAELLDATTLPVAEIGARVGWPDAHHFARRFRAQHGVAPSAYRARRS